MSRRGGNSPPCATLSLARAARRSAACVFGSGSVIPRVDLVGLSEIGVLSVEKSTSSSAEKNASSSSIYNQEMSCPERWLDV